MDNKANIIIRLVFSVFFTVLCVSVTANGRTYYVDDNASGANDGSSWANAFNYLQSALSVAGDNDEIKVAQGIYTPGDGFTADPNDTFSDSRDATFELVNDVVLTGGYAGVDSEEPGIRDIKVYRTILSGDLDGDDIDIISAEDQIDIPTIADNCWHVVTCKSNAVLDGFAVVGGNADGLVIDRNDSRKLGGGMFIVSGSPTVINCTFVANYGDHYGGAIYNSSDNANITNCVFDRNSSRGGGGGIYNNQCSPDITNCMFTQNSTQPYDGGGIYNCNSNSVITNCTFADNWAASDGGGMYNEGSTPTLTNCTFRENHALNDGGGIYNEESSLNLADCTFIENTADDGGGIYNEYSSTTLTNCVFINNTGHDKGGGMCNIQKSLSGDSPVLRNCLFIINQAGYRNRSGSRGGGIYNHSCEPVLTNCTFAVNWAGDGNALYCKSDDERNTVTLSNCILWDLGDEIWNDDNSIINISYSNIWGGWPGEGNIDMDPLFVDISGPDYRSGTEDDNYKLSPLSPCIDAGDPNYVPEPNETDLDGDRRIVNSLIDMGAYEFQGRIYVDDDSPYEIWRGEPEIDYPDGTEVHPFATIQQAIDTAKDGYTVLVRPGTYNKIDYRGKAITVTGTEGAAVIEAWSRDPAASRDAVTFHTGEGPDSVLKNVVIRNSNIAISLNFSSPKIHNITIADNNFGIAAYENSNPEIRNCILWDNRDGDLFQCEAQYSCIENGIRGEGNISVNPLFVDTANGDYHLKSEGWRWNSLGESWTYDQVTSRCIDAGDPDFPLGDELMSVPRDPDNTYGVNLRLNMGAFGGTCQASMPPLGWAPPEDITAPVPNPAQWALGGAPQMGSRGGRTYAEWTMTAAEAADDSGPVEYFFKCTTNPALSSGWQRSPEYSILTDWESGQNQRFRVKARDLYGNETAWSEEWPFPEPEEDTTAPTHSPTRWAQNGEPHEVNVEGGTFDYYIEMEAEEATDASGFVKYYFECTTNPDFSSDWQSSRAYRVQVGRRGQGHSFRVKVRDLYGNETAWSEELPVQPPMGRQESI